MVVIQVQSRAQRKWSAFLRILVALILISATVIGWILYENNRTLQTELQACKDSLQAKNKANERLSLGLSIVATVGVVVIVALGLLAYQTKKNFAEYKGHLQSPEYKKAMREMVNLYVDNAERSAVSSAVLKALKR